MRMIRLVLLATILLAALAASASAEPETGTRKAPIPLFAPPPQTPIEGAGITPAPKVSIALEIGTEGRVTSVDVIRVDPGGEHDAAFADAARAAFSRWRFAPGTRDGQPVASSFSLTYEFVPRSRRDAEGGVPRTSVESEESEGGRIRIRLPVDERQRVLMMPVRPRLALQRKLVGDATAFFGTAELQRAENSNFVVLTDIEAEGAAESLAGALGAAYGTVYELLAEHLPDYPAHGKVHALVFRFEQAYAEMTSRTHGHDRSAGFYHSAGVISFHVQVPHERIALGTLIHESVHALLDRHIVKPGVRLPTWLDEGFAEYIANSDIRRGKLIPGGHRQAVLRGYAPRYDMAYSLPPMHHVDAMTVRKAIRKDQALTLAEILEADQGLFYGEKRRLYYTQSWLLVHFLNHADESWAKSEFPRFLLYVAEGFPVRDAFRTVYGADPESFQDAYVKYVKKF